MRTASSGDVAIAVAATWCVVLDASPACVPPLRLSGFVHRPSGVLW